MEEHAGADVVRFSGFRFDRSHGCLLRQDKDGTFAPVAVGSRALDLLGLLIDRHGDLVSKDEILNAVWPGVVEGANVTVQISALRRVLDEGRSNGSLIQTVPGRGYRFVEPVTRDEPAAQRTIAPPSNSPRLSIVVLPFADLGGDPTQQYFADALTDDLTTDLSRIADMLVISRNTAFTYRDKPADTRQIGRELRVRYALEGSVRRLGNHIRINTQLVDAETDTHLWAERFDRDVEDLFALQDEVTSRIAIALKTELMAAEAARPTEHPDALDYLFKARAVLLQPRTRDNFAAAMSLFERALALDPSSVEAQSRLANALVYRVINDMTASRAADIARAEKLVSEALAASPRSALAHFVKGHLLRAPAPTRGGHSRIRDGDCARPQLAMGIRECQLVQTADRIDRRGDSARRETPPAQPSRSRGQRLELLDRARTPAEIAHRRGDPLVREGAQGQSGFCLHPRLPRLRLCPQWRGRTRRGRARRSAPTERGRTLLQHYALKGHSILWSAEGP